jgi:hypothetical protein
MTGVERILGLDPQRANPWGHSFLCLHYPCQDCKPKEAQAAEIGRLRGKVNERLI